MPTGHSLSRARLRHLWESEWVVATDDSVLVGLAAYKRADSDVRVVHELLTDRTLDTRDVARVTEVLLRALELAAYDDQVRCLMFVLFADVLRTPFAEHGYSTVIADASGVWLQKRLDRLAWVQSLPGRPS